MLQYEIKVADFKQIYGAELKAAVERVNAAMHAGEATAKQACPVGDTDHADGTPHMVDTIIVREATVEDPNAQLRCDAPYAGDVDLGHMTQSGGFVPPVPFFSRARDVVEQEMRRK